MNWLRCVLVLLLGTAGMFSSLEASAATTCTASMTDLEFGLGNTATATIEWECRTTGAFLTGNTNVSMCFGIGAGSGTGSTVTQRRMNNIHNDTLNFAIHKTLSNLADNWGNSRPTSYPLTISYGLTWLGQGSDRGTVVVRGSIPSRNGLAPGQYTSSFIDSTLVYRYADAWFQSSPTNCQTGGNDGGNSTFQFTARANVPGSCSVVAASDMNFTPGGAPLSGNTTGNLTSNSTINLMCTNRTVWQVGLDNGLHPSGTTRQMCNPGGACLAYQLNKPNGTTPWGNLLDVNTVPGTSTGTPQSLTVKGVVTDQPLTQAGRYSDTVKVILTY